MRLLVRPLVSTGHINQHHVEVHDGPGEHATESTVVERFPVNCVLASVRVEDFVAVAELDAHCANHEAPRHSDEVEIAPEHEEQCENNGS